MTTSTRPERLSTRVRMIEESFARRGVSIRSMKKAGSLELMQGVGDDSDHSGATLFNIDHLEHPDELIPRAVPRISPPDTQFRYFLDGAQKTLPVWRIGVVPIVVSYAVVGILERNDHAESILLPDSLAERRVWIIPKRTGHPVINDLVSELVERGETVWDPIQGHPAVERIGYGTMATQFNRMVELSYSAAMTNRSNLEQEALGDWGSNNHRKYPDGWIVIDGRLHGDHPRSVGLVKNLLTQIVHGPDAVTLFDLEHGHRTTAFNIRPGDDDRRDIDRPGGSTNWYMRFWNAEGFDARHALVRIEAQPHIRDTDTIDEISSWILAERLPRATDDPRWPTLLYPIHFLEKILKRRLASMTTGWPA